MRALQVIAFLALMLGAGGIEDQAHNIQPTAVVMIAVALIGLLAAAAIETLTASGKCTGGK